MLAEYTAGAAGILLAAPLWSIPAVAALVPVAGRPILSWLPVVGHWGIRRALAHTRHRVRLQDLTASELELPGVGCRLRVIEATGSSAALIHDPRDSTITAMLSASGTGFALTDDATQQRRVAGWGRLLASLCQQPSVVRLQVLQRCLPGGGAPVRRWWAEHALTDAPWAARVLAELVADAEQVTDRHECLLAIAIRTSRSGKRGTSPASLAAAEEQLAAVAEAARAADLDVHGWVARQRLSSVLRVTYDPLGVARRDPEEPEDGASTSLLAGPMAIDEDWASIRTDSAHHAVYWVQEWPRSEVHAGFLQPLLLAPGARRALSLTAEPLSPTKALRDIRRAKVEHAADADHRAR
ncbi:MAG: SCO6880 family protein, partial [Actinomycetota bacterium]